MLKKWLTNKDKFFWIPICLGIFIIINNLIWIIINGGRWFEPFPTNGTKPDYYNDLNRIFGPFYMLFYFTIQTNIFLAISFILLACFKSTKYQTLFGSSCFLITITFLLYWAAIAPFSEDYLWKSVYYQFYNIFVHVVNPLIGFIYLICIRKKITINKTIVGKVCLYIPAFIIMNAVLYGCGATIDSTTNQIDGASIYSFLDLQHVLFINLTKLPGLAWVINILLILVSPFIGITLSIIWIWCLRTETKHDSYYYNWIHKLKTNINKKREYF